MALGVPPADPGGLNWTRPPNGPVSSVTDGFKACSDNAMRLIQLPFPVRDGTVEINQSARRQKRPYGEAR